MLESGQSVLFVCRENICRSIAAEGVFRYLVASTGVRVAGDSAGVQALPGRSPDPKLCSVAALRGYDFSQLRSRVFRVGDFAGFDLILAASRDNLSRVRALAPAGTPARVELLMDYSEMFSVREVPFPDSQREYALMLDCVEDACLGLYHHLTGG